MTRLYTLISIVLFLSLISLSCSQEPQQKEQSPRAASPPANPAVEITATRVRQQTVERTLEFVGSLLPNEEVTVSSLVSGKIETVLVDLGDRVTKGQLLVRLDQREFRLKLEQSAAALRLTRENLAKAALTASQAAIDTARQELAAAKAQVDRAEVLAKGAKTNLDRMAHLFSQGIVAESQRDIAQTGYDSSLAQLRATQAEFRSRQSRLESAKAQSEQNRAAIKVAEAGVGQAQAALAYARKKLSDTIIYSPIEGEVQERLVSAGETIKENAPLLNLTSTNPVKLEGEVAERFVPALSIGKKVRVRVAAFPDQEFIGRISRLSPVVTPESRSLKTQALIDNPHGRLKPGFFAKAYIVNKIELALFVPEKSLVTIVGITKLFVVDQQSGIIQARRVSTGIRLDNLVEVSGEIKAGELVATSGLSRLTGGTRVKILSEKASEG
ncbi:MAG: efflux RND transporter periplasmic adaptor subunit [Thermodesulfobacteriota bacterium]